MKGRIWLTAFIAATFPLLAAVPSSAREPYLVDSAWLAKHSSDANLVLFHVGDPAEFEKEHIPGAVFIRTSDIAAPQGEGQNLAMQMPTVEQLKEIFEKFGVSDDSRIIIYFGKDWVTPTARVYLTLEYLGLGDRTSILDGGMPAWKEAGQPVTAEVKTPARGSLTPKPNPEVLAEIDWVSANLKNESVAILDARNESFYNGSPGRMPRGGHIPGARSIPFPTLVEENNKMKGISALRELFSAAGVKPGMTVVTYCHIGQQASLLYLAARLLGYDARMFDGSFEEWSRRSDLPVETPAPAPAPAAPPKP